MPIVFDNDEQRQKAAEWVGDAERVLSGGDLHGYLHGALYSLWPTGDDPSPENMAARAQQLREVAEKVYLEDSTLWLELHRDADRWIQTAAICRRLDETKGDE